MNDDNNYRKDFHESIEAILDDDEGVLSGWVLVTMKHRQDDQEYLTVNAPQTRQEEILPLDPLKDAWLNYDTDSGIPSMEFDGIERKMMEG